VFRERKIKTEKTKEALRKFTTESGEPVTTGTRHKLSIKSLQKIVWSKITPKKFYSKFPSGGPIPPE
jgi:hypothetical protein